FRKNGNKILKEFVFDRNLKWIDYNKLKNVEYLDEGGFGIIYKAIWLRDNENKEVILKCYNNLNENLNEFLNEWTYHESCSNNSNDIIDFYGFTKNPDTLQYLVVMDYANKGNLRGNLTRIVKNNWKQKLYMLYKIISGLNDIHEQDLIHCDFHDGNILNHIDNSNNNLSHYKEKIYIGDLGLCQPVKSSSKKDGIYGVIPFMAPEVLRGKSYTPASDIYSLSMIMWEFTSGVPPFKNIAHDLQLSLSICKGERPGIIKNTPQCYVDLMKKCWDEDPLKRPSSKELLDIIREWIFLPEKMKIEDISEELKCNIMKFTNAPIGHNDNLIAEFHPQACYTSRLLDFTSKKLNEILEIYLRAKIHQYKKLLDEVLLNTYLNPNSKPNGNTLLSRNKNIDEIINSTIVNLNIPSLISRWIAITGQIVHISTQQLDDFLATDQIEVTTTISALTPIKPSSHIGTNFNERLPLRPLVSTKPKDDNLSLDDSDKTKDSDKKKRKRRKRLQGVM
ncbi:kinase-like protein, partial [Rhizophagus irregularis]